MIQPGDDAYEGFYEPRDFLDFTNVNSFEYLDHSLMLDIPQTTAARSGYATPNKNSNGLSLSAQAYEESLWLWTPGQDDNASKFLLMSLILVILFKS